MTKDEYNKEYKKKNRQKLQDYNKRYYQENKEKIAIWGQNNRKSDKYKEKAIIHSKVYRSNNKHKIQIRMRFKKYGITKEQYDVMYLNQLGLCAICHKPFGEETPHVDHCHNTGKIRGLLHKDCNLLLGCAGDCPDKLRFAAEYLESKSVLQLLS